MSKWYSFDDLPQKSRSEEFIIDQVKGNPKVVRNRKPISVNQPTEMYLNETELKKAAVDKFLIFLRNCMTIPTDNMPLIVGNGKRVKTRNPGMSDQHLCLRGFFIALEGKMPGKTLDPDQVTYKNRVLNSGGKFIEYHSIFELETEMLKLKLISRRIFK